MAQAFRIFGWASFSKINKVQGLLTMAVMVPKSPQAVDPRYQVSQPQSQVYKLGEILQRRQLISGCQLQLAIQSQSKGSCHRKIGEILIEQRAISPFDLQVALREQSWRQQGYWVID